MVSGFLLSSTVHLVGKDTVIIVRSAVRTEAAKAGSGGRLGMGVSGT